MLRTGRQRRTNSTINMTRRSGAGENDCDISFTEPLDGSWQRFLRGDSGFKIGDLWVFEQILDRIEARFAQFH